MTSLADLDRADVSYALGAGGALRAFNDAGILSPSDVHVAARLCALAGTGDERVSLGAALAVRAPRLGHVCVDLASIRTTASSESDTDVDLDLDRLPWPDPPEWLRSLAESPLVGDDRPLHLAGSRLYLDRLWLDEQRVAAALLARAVPVPPLDEEALRAGVRALFGEAGAVADRDPEQLQPVAAATAALRRLSVIAGGPGTGKTTTVARVLALLDAQEIGAGRVAPQVALAAPTGKAAARLEEAVRSEAARLDVTEEVRAHLVTLRGTTIHRLLGFDPGNRTRFRHDAEHHLPDDIVVVDETSMVALSLMARLLEAVRPDARLILVGDPEQLASVEAGAVLGDVVGPALAGPRMGAAMRGAVEGVTGHAPGRAPSEPHAPIADSVVVLRHVHRHGGAIAALARAVQRGDADEALEVLRAGDSNVEWVEAPDGAKAPEHLEALRRGAVTSGAAAIEAARAGDARAALGALGAFRLLCAHRRGPDGVATWSREIEGWLAAEVPGFATGSDWYVGRPLIITENDHLLQLFNGDVGVVVRGDKRPMVAAFERGGEVVAVSPTRLAAVDTVYAMTVHKSQGSQFTTVGFVLPAAESRVLSRELLYTAVTRAQEHLILVGPEASVRSAIARPIARASGLRRALWGEED
jgi:exodeoxyribonuclease V alpha subunit